jgi:hypothetical protein
MNPWKELHHDFHALKEAEDWIARERVPAAHCLCVCWRSRHRQEEQLGREQPVDNRLID